MADYIDGSPDGMSLFDAQGPGRIDPGQRITSQMAGGQRFARVDEVASKNLATFVKDANFGLPKYGVAAKAAAKDYFNADEASRIAIRGVVRG